MKTGKALYILAILIASFMAVVMFINQWAISGMIISVMVVSGIVNYIDINHQNKVTRYKTTKSRRAAYFNSLSHEEQEKFMANMALEKMKSIKNKK